MTLGLETALFRWPQNKPTTGQSWAHQQLQWHFGDKVFKKVYKLMQRICVKQKKHKVNRSADIKFSQKGGEEVLQTLEERFPCRPWWSRLFPQGKRTLLPCSRWTHPERSCSLQQAHTGVPGRNCSPLKGDCAGEGFLAGAAVCGNAGGNPFLKGLQPVGKDPWQSSSWKTAWGKDNLGEDCEEFYPMGSILFIHIQPTTTSPVTQRMESKCL